MAIITIQIVKEVENKASAESLLTALKAVDSEAKFNASYVEKLQ